MKRILTSAMVAAVACAVASTAAQAQTVKIGVFNPQRVIEETAEGQRIKARLEKLFEDKQQELAGQEAAIAELQKQLQTQSLSLSADKRTELERQIQRKVLDLNSARERAGQELQLEQAELRSRFEQQLLQVVDMFGQRDGFTVILDAGQIAWAAQTIDCTTAIVDLFDEMVKPAEGS